jgi:hypothetical protein
MACNNCYEDFLCKCTPYSSAVSINTSVVQGQYFIRLIDVQGNKFDVDADWSAQSLEFQVSDFPDGYFSGAGSQFTLEVYRNDNVGFCAPVKIPLVRYYDCISVSITGGTSDKSTIGCGYDCAPSTSNQSSLVTFTDQTQVTISWAPFLGTYGNNPLIQVFHLVSPGIYQLADVAVQTSFIDGVLDSILIDNGGSATGYVVISS